MIIARENYLTEACSIGDDRYRFDKFSVGINEGAATATLFNSNSKFNIFKAVAAKTYQISVKDTRQHINNVIDKLESETEIMYNYLNTALKNGYSEKEFKQYIRSREKAYGKYMMKDNDNLLQSARLISQHRFVDVYKTSDKLAKDFDELVADIEKKFIKSIDNISKKINDIYSNIEKLIKVDGYPEEKVNWMRQEYNALVKSFKDLADDLNVIYSIASKIERSVSESSITVSNEFDPTTYFSFQDEDKVCPGLFDDEKVFYRDPVYNKAIMEYFNMSDRKTCRTLTRLNEAGQNTVLMSLTSKLYDKIVAKCDDIDYGEIPATKGDITKLSKYNDMKETISIMHDILKEYKQDTGPIDELSVALSNVEARKDLFERAYRYNCELPIAMYCNVVLGIITGISYMIATCIEFIKDPGTNSFRIALDKMAYAKTKDHMIYNTLKSFNKSCANKDFDKAMEAVLKAGTKNFAGSVAIGGIAIGVIGTILLLIPVLRELIFLFYYTRMRVSDFFDIQADLLQANAYSLESNSTLDVDEQKKIAAKQLKTVERFRKISNTFAIDIKKAEVASTKEKLQDDESKMLIDDIESIDSGAGSALF